MGSHQKTNENQRALILTLCVSILSAFFCAFQLLKIPADSKNAFLFGLSKERLMMLSGFAGIIILLLLCLIINKKLLDFLEKKTYIKIIFNFLAVIGLFFLLMPDYRFGRSAAKFLRIKPYILLIFLISSSFSLFFNYKNNRFAAIRETITNFSKQKKYILLALFILIACIFFVEITGFGKTRETALWNKNGIPLQSIQLYSALVLFYVLLKTGILSKIAKNKKWLNFFLIWIISAIIWSQAPMISHFFAPGPYEPNLTFYPYSDAVTYDLPAQTALNGWEFNFGGSLLKPTVVFISFLTRYLTKNNTTTAMLLQSAFYAILPAIIYLFGCALGGFGCGYLAAAFSLLKEWNALRTISVSTVHSRLVMSEFLTQILFALFCYAIFRWLQKSGKETLYAIIAGGCFCLGIFTRYNFLAMLPAALLLLIVAYWKNFRSLAKPMLFFLLSILLTAAPFLYRESKVSWNIFDEFERTVRSVLIRQRFQGEDPWTTHQNLTVENAENAESENNSETTDITEVEFNTSQITQEFSNNISNKNLSVFESMLNHGNHNIISSILTLPIEWMFQDLNHLYKQDGDGLWRDEWDGSFSTTQWAAIAVWTVLGAVSMGCLVRFHGLAGFSIIYFWVVYAFSIGFSRSSGGRYIVPTNWIPMLLLAFCCLLFFSRGKVTISKGVVNRLPVWKPVCTMALFTAFFTGMVLFETLLPSKSTSAEKPDLDILKENLINNEINWDLVEEQLNSGIMHISRGVAVYPRFYYYKTGEHSASGAMMEKDFSRMTFIGINRDESEEFSREYLMPHKELIGDFPQDSIYRALSCSSSFGYEDILAVTIETPQGQQFTYVRDPLPEFSCPVPEPVCTANEVCY